MIMSRRKPTADISFIIEIDAMMFCQSTVTPLHMLLPMRLRSAALLGFASFQQEDLISYFTFI